MSKTKPPRALCGEDLDKALSRTLRRTLNLMETVRNAEDDLSRLSEHVCTFEHRDGFGACYTKTCYKCDNTKLNTECIQRCTREMQAVDTEFADLLGLRVAELYAELGPLRGEQQTLQDAIVEMDMLRNRSELLEADISEIECWVHLGRATEKFNKAHPSGYPLDLHLQYDEIFVPEWEVLLEVKIDERAELKRQLDQALKRVMGMRR
jgi:hypothetical protein